MMRPDHLFGEGHHASLWELRPGTMVRRYGEMDLFFILRAEQPWLVPPPGVLKGMVALVNLRTGMISYEGRNVGVVAFAPLRREEPTDAPT